jgi:hypothetical protein
VAYQYAAFPAETMYVAGEMSYSEHGSHVLLISE